MRNIVCSSKIEANHGGAVVAKNQKRQSCSHLFAVEEKLCHFNCQLISRWFTRNCQEPKNPTAIVYYGDHRFYWWKNHINGKILTCSNKTKMVRSWQETSQKKNKLHFPEEKNLQLSIVLRRFNCWIHNNEQPDALRKSFWQGFNKYRNWQYAYFAESEWSKQEFK